MGIVGRCINPKMSRGFTATHLCLRFTKAVIRPSPLVQARTRWRKDTTPICYLRDDWLPRQGSVRFTIFGHSYAHFTRAHAIAYPCEWMRSAFRNSAAAVRNQSIPRHPRASIGNPVQQALHPKNPLKNVVPPSIRTSLSPS